LGRPPPPPPPPPPPTKQGNGGMREWGNGGLGVGVGVRVECWGQDWEREIPADRSTAAGTPTSRQAL
jgi:hypothetical protein